MSLSAGGSGTRVRHADAAQAALAKKSEERDGRPAARHPTGQSHRPSARFRWIQATRRLRENLEPRFECSP